jgi:hypothetical protein
MSNSYKIKLIGSLFGGTQKWLEWYGHIRKAIYLTHFALVFSWLSISAYAYVSVMNGFGSIPGNDALVRLALEKNINVSVISPSFDEGLLSFFCYSILVMPLFIVLDSVVFLNWNRTKRSGAWALISIAVLIISILCLRMGILGWYFGFIVD